MKSRNKVSDTQRMRALSIGVHMDPTPTVPAPILVPEMMDKTLPPYRTHMGCRVTHTFHLNGEETILLEGGYAGGGNR